MDYIFDGSYSGYLCCVFEAFERKEFDSIPTTEKSMEINIFSEKRQVHTDVKKAMRILVGMEKILRAQETKIFYLNFLSDNQSEWLNGFRLIVELFRRGKLDIRNYGYPPILRIHQTIKKISRERHRMKAFIRFVKSNDNLYTAIVEPDFNVIPLVVDFFKNRFADQCWLIYDIRRNYGFHYDRKNILEVSNNNTHEVQDPYQLEVDLDPQEKDYQHLWKTYFKNTSIESRKNLKLHLRHVPKRYWKYLVEKQ